MIRTLSANEIRKIKDFVTKVGPEITPAQRMPDSQDDGIDPVPGKIQALLLELIARSNNDHLLNYLEKLNSSDNEVDILNWLEAIKAAHSNLFDPELNDNDKLCRNLYREAARLAFDTSLSHAANALQAMATLPYPMTLKKYIAFVQESTKAYGEQQKKDKLRQSYDYYGATTYISTDDLKKILLKHTPKPVLYRSRSEIKTSDLKKIASLSPLREHLPVTAINFPRRKICV